jgi:GrpB-like predicted nucleotidyltransferase (UPF0157 family)
MTGNCHVQFLGGGAAVTSPCYPARGRVTALSTATAQRGETKKGATTLEVRIEADMQPPSCCHGSKLMQSVVVVDYDPMWPEIFEQLRTHVWSVLHDVALTIEHVGSTSVPGLAAKPIIDMSVVVASKREVPLAIARLATLGYEHLGNRGIEDREAFRHPEGLPAHHLYVCPQGSLALRNHLAVRDYLRAHPETAHEYGELKKRLAQEFPNDIESYVDGKTNLMLKVLREQGIAAEQLVAIEQANRKK